VSDFERFLRLLAAVDADGSKEAGASGDDDAELDQKPTLWSLDADSMRDVAALTSTLSTPDLWPYSSSAGRIDFSSSLYFHTRTVLSLPPETSLLLDKHLKALIDETCPPAADVASSVPFVASQARSRPS
jgi:hypothetical protein